MAELLSKPTSVLVFIVILSLSACGLEQQASKNPHPSQKAPAIVSSINVVKNDLEVAEISWRGQVIANAYKLQLSLFEDFSDSDPKIIALTQPRFPLTDLIAGETYYVKITAIWDTRQSSASAIFTFVVPPKSPDFVIPNINTITGEVSVRWEGDSDNYRVYWSKSSDISKENYEEVTPISGQSQITYSLRKMNLQQGDKLYFLVTASKNGAESFSSISSQSSISITATDLIVRGPKVISVFPGNNKNNIDITLEKINITFEEEVAAASINIDTVEIFRPDNSKVSGTVSYNSRTKTASFTPNILWVSNTNYTLILKAGSSGIKDGNNISLASDFKTNFSTKLPELTITNLIVLENSNVASLTVLLNLPSGSPASFTYFSKDDSAVAGEDYEKQTGIITFKPGDTSSKINIPINNDDFYEKNEQFYVNFSDPSGLKISKTLATVTIDDDETSPKISIEDVTVNENQSFATLTTKLSHASKFPISMEYSTTNLSAEGGENLDYLQTSGLLNFAAGETEQSFNITINNDLLPENTESFNVNFSEIKGAILANPLSIVTIVDNDDLPNINMSDIAVDEAIGTVEVKITLSAISNKIINVNYEVKEDSATAGVDYTSKIGKIVFQPGVSQRTIKINIIDDTLYENPENIKLTISNAVDNDGIIAAKITTSQINIKIIDNDTPPSVSIANVSVSESTINAVLTATLSNVSGKDTVINYSTLNDTATADIDYTSQTSSVTISAGQLSNTFNIEILDNKSYENDEQFKIDFSDENSSTGNAIVTINDDDPKPSLNISDIRISENVGMAVITLNLSDPSELITTLTYRTVNGSAIAKADFTEITNGNLAFPAGVIKANISFDILNDSIAEADEQFTIEAISLDGASFTKGKATITIENDDTPAQPVLTLSNGDRQVILTWPNILGASSYNVYYSRKSGISPSNYATQDGTLILNQSSGLVFTSFIQSTYPTGLKLDVDYYFVITASANNLMSESLPSSEEKIKLKIIPTKPINDTGITFGGEPSTGNNKDCSGTVINQQDCSMGRDALQNDDSDGHAGFSYSKIDNDGIALTNQSIAWDANGSEASYSKWSCVKDNLTKLVWEVKTDNLYALRHWNQTFTWYNSTGTNDGGDHGIGDTGLNTTTGFETSAGSFEGSDNCSGKTRCDTEKYVTDVNSSNRGAGLCGATNWRLPTLEELESLVNLNVVTPAVAVDLNYFPNTYGMLYWASTPLARNAYRAWYVDFGNGISAADYRYNSYSIRLVRGGK